MARKYETERSLRKDFAALMALAIDNPDRAKLHERVRLTGKALERRAAKFCTLSPEFKPNPIALDRRPLPRKPIYPAWTSGTRQSEPLPFESGRKTLPGMERFAHDYAEADSAGNGLRV